MGEGNDRQKIGLYIATSLVVGNMIGSGIFLLPASLAKLGGISLFGWVISGAGALLIAFVYARLSKRVTKSGGPYQYPKEGFGEFIGFLSGWGYWVSTVFSIASISMVFTSYFLVFLPSFQGSGWKAALISLTAIWFLTWLNTRGVKAGGRMQLMTTVLKIIPLIAVVIFGIFYFDSSHFVPLNQSSESNFVAIGASVSLTLFAFLGIESATVPVEDVKDARKVVPKATIIGTLITLVIYLGSSVVIMGMIGPDDLVNSSAPFADAAYLIWGNSGKFLISIGALISTFGALNGWILVQGQMPLAMAKDHLFPPIFKKLSKRNFPLAGLLISSGLISIIILANQSRGLVELFSLLILLSVFLNLITYLFSSLAEALILIKTKPDGWKKKLIPSFLLSIPAFAFSLWAIYGSGLDIVFNGFLLLMLGTPLYVWSKIVQVKSQQ